MSNNLGILSMIGSSLFGGGNSPVIKMGVLFLSPLLFSLFRFLIASLSSLVFINRSTYRLQSFKDTWLVNLLFLINALLFAFGIQKTNPNVGQLIYMTTPIFIYLYSLVVFKDQISVKKIIGIIIGFIGIVILVTTKSTGNIIFTNSLVGNLMILVASLTYGLYMIYSKKVQKKVGVMTIIFNSNLLIFISLFVICLPQLIVFDYQRLADAQAWGSVIYAGIFGTTIAFGLSQIAIKHGSPLLSSLSTFMLPLFTVIWSYMLFGETISSGFFIASIMVLLGAFLVSY